MNENSPQAEIIHNKLSLDVFFFLVSPRCVDLDSPPTYWQLKTAPEN